MGVGEKSCPYCGAWQPGMFGYGPVLRRAFGGAFDLGNVIIAYCVVLYLLSLAIDPGAIQMRGLFDLLAPSGAALYHLGMTGGYAWAAGQWWTLATATFLHGSLLHILFNMLILKQFMPNVVDLWGAPRAFLVFMAGGIGGFLISNVATGHPTIGASGAIFGLLGALISYGRRTHQGHITQQLWISAIFMFVMGFTMGSVNNWAHAGGFAAGFGTAELMPTSHRREGMGVLLLAGFLALVSVAGVVLSFLGFTRLLSGR